MVGRSEKKMKEKMEEIQRMCTDQGLEQVETRCVIADFSKMYTIQEYKEKVAD